MNDQMFIYNVIILFSLLVAVVVLDVAIYMPRLNRFFERVAKRHTATWEKLGRPPYDRRWSSPGRVIVLPYLLRRRYRKFDDDDLTHTGDTLRRFAVLLTVLSLLCVFALLNLIRIGGAYAA